MGFDTPAWLPRREATRWYLSAQGCAVLLLTAVVASSGTASYRPPAALTAAGRVLVDQARFPAAMVALPSGGLRFGERTTGLVREVNSGGQLQVTPIARIAVSVAGQRGLLGLAVDATSRTFAAWTRPDGRLVVGQVAPGPQRLVWLGPPSSELANGGHLIVDPRGTLIVGIGDLGHPSLVKDPSTPNGKLLRLAPDAPPTQRPSVLSAGWNNPFAFAYTPDGQLWVADNSPGHRPERIARGDHAGQPTAVTNLADETAPSGLAPIDNRHLALCGYVSHRLDLYTLDRHDHARRHPAALATDCTIGVIMLADHELAYANETHILALPAPH